MAKSCGLIRGEWIAIDGSEFRAVASMDSARERFQLQRYLDGMEKADSEQQEEVDVSGVQAALDKLKEHPEPEANFMLMRGAPVCFRDRNPWVRLCGFRKMNQRKRSATQKTRLLKAHSDRLLRDDLSPEYAFGHPRRPQRKRPI